jgi:hypothetical protein
VQGFYARRAREQGQLGAKTGSVTVLQRTSFVYPPLGGFWGAYRQNLVPSSTIHIGLTPST